MVRGEATAAARWRRFPPSHPRRPHLCPTSSSPSHSHYRRAGGGAAMPSTAAQLCPADKLFYKGHLLPLHLSPQLSMVRTLLLSSVSTSSSDITITASHDSNGNSSSTTFSTDLGGLLPDSDSSCPSSITEDDARRGSPFTKCIKYLSCFAIRFSFVFLHRGNKTDRSNDLNINQIPLPPPPPPSKRLNSSPSSVKEVIKKYVKKVKPLYEKISSLLQKQSQQ